ncbi:hypothetical protein Mapa_016920 [Marchantia paleacea]|nr:hypothetical protein Mapa_016920 [Marchantia paleacea]
MSMATVMSSSMSVTVTVPRMTPPHQNSSITLRPVHDPQPHHCAQSLACPRLPSLGSVQG